MVDDPFEGRAVAESVVVGFFGNAAQGQELVVYERSFVFAQLHFGDAVVELFAFLLYFRELVLCLFLVVDVDFGKALTGFGEGAEEGGAGGGSSCLRASLSGNGLRQSGIVFFFFVYPGLTSGAIICRPYGAGGWWGRGPVVGHKGDARQFAAEVGGVALAVVGVVKDGVDVVEDVPLRDGGVVVVRTELFEGPVSDVLAAVGFGPLDGELRNEGEAELSSAVGEELGKGVADLGFVVEMKLSDLV